MSPIECPTKQPTENTRRQPPLTIDEYESHYRLNATDLELTERIFYSSMATNQLRAALWPYVFGLVPYRCRFRLIDDKGNYAFEDHENNREPWKELEKQYHVYKLQWQSIQADQELRFSSFRERKALIERDVIRSDRSHPFYADRMDNLEALSSLLMTYMMYDFDIGYMQGMSDIAAPILYLFDGDLVRSFWVFVEVMKLFRRNFENSQKTIHFQLNCLHCLIKRTDPKLASYLNESQCSNCFFAFRCIVCKFKRELMRTNQDYDLVLSLWDSIWTVQRRYELLAKSKFVHTFTIHHYSKSSSTYKMSRHQSVEFLTNGKSKKLINETHTNGNSRNYHHHNHHLPNKNLQNFTNHSYHLKNHKYELPISSPLSLSPNWSTNWSQQQNTEKSVHHEQIIYTKETFYSSFDPNQADIPRFELTETEKFVISLCLSLIRRERNYILEHQLDSSEIHQHFHSPQLDESNLNSLIEQAYNIYHFINSDCDIQLILKESNELDTCLTVDDIIDNVDSPQRDRLPGTANTYDLLRDYLIVTPASYGNQPKFRCNVSQESWDEFLNKADP